MKQRALDALLVDPSLFTAPYDAALDAALTAAGVHTRWAIRPLRAGQRREIPAAHSDEFFYRRVDDMTLPAKLRSLAKGLAHIGGLAKLVARVWRRRPDVVHFQWTPVPLLDALAIALIRLVCPVVLTVHDTTAHNGSKPAGAVVFGFDLPMRLADRLIVHTRAGREALVARGLPGERIETIAHGPLKLNEQPSAGLARDDGRVTFVAFGEMKAYKGLDVLVEAAAALPAELRSQARIVIAGRPMMDTAPLHSAIAAHGLASTIELRERRLTEQEMADLFAHTDCFVFPYRQIDASGVFFLVRSMQRWLIASRVGIFAEALREGAEGVLVPPQDAAALAAAMADAIRRRPTAAAPLEADGWEAIGEATLRLYRSVARRQASAGLAAASASTSDASDLPRA